MEINHKLRESTATVAFHLTLSQRMVAAMQYVKLDAMLCDAGLNSFDARKSYELVPMGSYHAPALKGLEARGLTIFKEPHTPEGRLDWSEPFTRLTPAGERVWDLLVMAGVVSELTLPANLAVPQKGAKKRA